MSFALCCMVFGILLFFPETDAGELTWKEPLPIQTVPDNNLTDHFSKKEIREGDTNATLKWHFALTGLSFDSLVILFGGQAIAGARSSAQGPQPGFENQYDINWVASQNLVKLFIFNVTTEVNGIFTCRVITIRGYVSIPFSSNVEVDVVAPPSIIFTSSDHTITAPAELTLNCSADGKPEPTITWSRVSDDTVIYMPLTITGGKDEESYRCTADNGVGKPLIKVVNITILYKPDDVSLSVPTKVCAGTEVTFTCLAGAANPSVQNYVLYKFFSGLVNINSNQVGVFKDTLLIIGLYNYICKASNSVGNTSSHNRTVEVQVSGSIKTADSTIHVLEGASISVHCNFSGFHSKHVSWINASNYIVETGNILKFANISRSYGGEYKCSASNVCGGDSKRVFIDVQYPVEATSTGQNYCVLQGKSEILTCPVAGNPEPNITWYNSSGASVSSEKELETGESGCYTCVANNFFGTSINITECLIVRTGTQIPGQLTIGADYMEEYRDLNSSMSIIFVAEFVEEMKRRCVHFPWYMGTEVTNLSRGSVIVEFILYIEIAKTEENRLGKLKAAISANGTFGRYTAGDLVLLSDEITTSTTSVTSGSPKPTEFKCSCPDNETTLLIIIGVLVIIIITLIAIIIWQQRKLRVIGNRRPYEVPEEKDTGFYDNEIAMKHVNPTHLRPKNSTQLQIPNELEHMPLQGVLTGEGSISPETLASNVEYAPLDVRTRSWEVARNDVQVEKIIGKGAFGQVAVGTAINLPFRSGTTTVAIKMVKANAPETDKRDLKAELELMKTLKPHPHVIKLLGSVTESEPLLVLIEYVPYGDLLGYLRKSRGLNDTYFKDPDIKPKTSLTSQQLIKFAWQIADGMSYLSLRKVIHRDLAARNVLVGERETCKITDFGMARDVQGENIYERKTKGRLPVKWTAYESLLYGQYTTKSDVWSYGVLLYEISTIGGSPYPRMEGRKIASLLQQGYRMPKPEHVDNDLYQIMRNCWQKEPKARPSFSDLTQQLNRMENQHKKLINMHIYDNTLYAHIEDLNA